MLKLYDLSINGVKNPPYAPCKDLYIGWKLDSDNTGVLQRAYTASIAKTGDDVPAWVSEGTTRSVHIPVDGILESHTDYILTVTATDNHGETATATLAFATALNPEDWQGKWIKPKKLVTGWAPYLRTKFRVKNGIKAAKLFVSGLGCGEYYINNQKISEDLIDPPMTNYEREVFYRVYDVTAFIKEGKNAFAALLGEGFYAQSRVWSHTGFYYGDPCLMARLELILEDGTKTVLVTDTDGSWSYKYSPIVLNNIYGGETYDTRLETPDFADPDGDEEGWGSVVEDATPKGELKLCMMPPIRIFKELPAVAVTNCSGKDGSADHCGHLHERLSRRRAGTVF